MVHCCQLSRAVFYFYLSKSLNEGVKDLNTLSFTVTAHCWIIMNNTGGAFFMCSLKYEDYDMNIRNVN